MCVGDHMIRKKSVCSCYIPQQLAHMGSQSVWVFGCHSKLLYNTYTHTLPLTVFSSQKVEIISTNNVTLSPTPPLSNVFSLSLTFSLPPPPPLSGGVQQQTDPLCLHRHVWFLLHQDLHHLHALHIRHRRHLESETRRSCQG